MNYKELFLFCLTACLLCTDLATDRLSFHLLSAPLITVFLLGLLTSFLPSKIRVAVQIVLGECIIALCIIDCYCQIYFRTPVNPQIFSNILLSDHRETKEFLSTFIGSHVLLQWRIVCLLFLALIYPFSFLVRLYYPCSKEWSKKWRLGTIIMLSVCILYEVPATYKFLKLFSNGEDLQRTEGLIFRHYHEKVSTPIHRFAFAYYASRQSSSMLRNIKRSTFSAVIDSCSYQSPHVVLIIGESYNKHHSSLYGYNLETTPLQKKRMDEGELFVFNNVVTPWNITSNVFVNMFSLWESDSKKPMGEYPLFPILFRRAGYNVTFFSNQYLLRGFRKSSNNQAGHFFLADAEMSDSLFSYRNRKSRIFDMGLFANVADYKKKTGEQTYTLDIIHLIGQHFNYSMRYPHSSAVFSQKDYKDRTMDNDATQIVMHYDNATRYNDIVLDKILSLYEDEEAIVLFVSDHGEEVYDELPIHGRLFQEPTAAQARQEYEVPMWIWCSRNYQASRPDIVEQIKTSVNKPFLTDGLPQILLSLAGISCEWSDNKHNLLHREYQCKPRIIAGNVDYDIEFMN